MAPLKTFHAETRGGFLYYFLTAPPPPPSHPRFVLSAEFPSLLCFYDRSGVPFVRLTYFYVLGGRGSDFRQG